MDEICIEVSVLLVGIAIFVVAFLIGFVVGAGVALVRWDKLEWLDE